MSGFLSVSNANAITEALDELGSLIVDSQRSSLAEQVTISRDDFLPTPALPRSGERAALASRRRQEVQASVSEGGNVEGSGMTSRAERIVEILKAGGVLGIKDISSNLPQYSEKMIQRELADLAAAGRVRKIGAKRWSKYELVQ